MKPLEHITKLRRKLNDEHAFADHLEAFADNHHIGMKQWFEKQWADLLLAETSKEKKIALDNLAKRYKNIGKGEP